MMVHLKKRLFESGRTAAGALFFHLTAVVLLTHCCGGQLQVVGPVQPVVVMIGDDVTLPCHLKPATDAGGMTFEWARPDLSPRFVHVRHAGKDLLLNQHPSYKGRTSVSIRKIQQGDISLSISTVKPADSGTYRCYLPHLDKDSTVQLLVGSVSVPVVSLAGIDRPSSRAILQCESAGWFPEPEVLWLDGEGKLVSAGPPETTQSPDGLYTVSSRVTVEKHSSSFTCRVQQKDVNQTREAHIYVAGDFFVAPSSSAACVSISLVACFICVLSVVFAVWRWRRNQINSKKTSQSENQQLMSEKTEEMEKRFAEHKDKVREELMMQRDQLKQHKLKLEELVEAKEEQLQSVETKLTENKERKVISPGYMELKEIITQYNWKLRDRLKELEIMVQKTDELLAPMVKSVTTTEEKKEGERHPDKK